MLKENKEKISILVKNVDMLIVRNGIDCNIILYVEAVYVFVITRCLEIINYLNLMRSV